MAAVNSHTGRRLWFITPHGLAMSASPVRLFAATALCYFAVPLRIRVWLGESAGAPWTGLITMLVLVLFMLAVGASSSAAQAWRDCIPGSIGPGGCDSIGPGGGKSIGPGGGLSIGPGGGLSIGPGGGQSIGPGGGQSIGPGGGQSLDRDRSRGLDPNTLRPYPMPGDRR